MKWILNGVSLVGVMLLLLGCGQADPFYTSVFRSDVFHQVQDESEYDFLWVFDNSDSMKDKRDFVKDNLREWMATLLSRKALRYQMAVTTTDYFAHAGALVQHPSGAEVVQSDAADPVSEMGAIIDNVQNSGTSFWEQGLESAYQAASTHGSKFMRNGVPLILIFLTDEEDYSCDDKCFGVQPEDNTNWVPFAVSRYVDYFKGLQNSMDKSVSVFPIVGTKESTCNVPSFGARYQELASKSGGFGESGSICSDELKESYENIAKRIADRGTRFVLNRQASEKGISVFVDQQQVIESRTNGFYYDETDNSIVFTGSAIPKNGQMIEAIYSETNE